MHLDWHLCSEEAFRPWKGHGGLYLRESSERQILEWVFEMGEIGLET